MTDQFPRARRIVKTDDFSSVFRLRPVCRTAHFVLYARKNEHAQVRLGIVVAKRFASRAVTRNAIKRISREIFRRCHDLPPMDCVVRLTTPINRRDEPASGAQLKRHLQKELQQLFVSLKKERK